MERIIRFSSTKTFLESRRYYALKYCLNLEKNYPAGGIRPAFAFDVGTLGHAALAAWAVGGDVEAAITASVAEQGIDPECVEVQAGRSAAQRYMNWTTESNVNANMTVVDVEKRTYVPLGTMHGDDVVLTFQPDIVVRDAFGMLHVRDYKFVTSYTNLGSDVADNQQGLCYVMGLEHEYGVLPSTFSLHQVHRKPPAKPRTPFFPVNIATQWTDPATIERYKAQLLNVLADMVLLHQQIEAGDWSKAYITNHVGINMTCSFADICCAGGLTKDPAQIADIINTRYRTKDTQL